MTTFTYDADGNLVWTAADQATVDQGTVPVSEQTKEWTTSESGGLVAANEAARLVGSGDVPEEAPTDMVGQVATDPDGNPIPDPNADKIVQTTDADGNPVPANTNPPVEKSVDGPPADKALKTSDVFKK